MKTLQKLKTNFKITLLLFLAATGLQAQSQCNIFKSEIGTVERFMTEVTQIIDSLSAQAEVAAFGANITKVRSNSKSVEILIGKALNSAEEAVIRVAESQYYSELCGINDVKSYTIDAESNTIDARDFLDEAYTNAKKAVSERTLGNIQYYMRKYQTASRSAKDAAEDATYAAAISHASCTHAENTSNVGSE